MNNHHENDEGSQSSIQTFFHKKKQQESYNINFENHSDKKQQKRFKKYYRSRTEVQQAYHDDDIYQIYQDPDECKRYFVGDERQEDENCKKILKTAYYRKSEITQTQCQSIEVNQLEVKIENLNIDNQELQFFYADRLCQDLSQLSLNKE